MRRGSTLLVYNGELWNAPALRVELEALGCAFLTTGDTEVLAHALDQWGEGALRKLEGMFACAWVSGDGVLRIARDRYGEVPLHAAIVPRVCFASEVKALRALGVPRGAELWVEPGTLWICEPNSKPRVRRWYAVPEVRTSPSPQSARASLRELLAEATRERFVSDVPVCTLLSGGIDSAIVALFLRERFPSLVSYIAVMDPKSKDLRCAREVARALDIVLREVRIPAPTSDDLARVVGVIEMPFKAQVEIGWPCLVLARQMQADGFKVTYSGEGSDELWASYGFAHHGVKKQGWLPYRRGLFYDQHRKNFPRANKVFMAHGVECRLPFLNRQLVETALSWSQDVVQAAGRPKAVLQDAFAGDLPRSVIKRSKMAFQEGLGIREVAAQAVANPKSFYAAEHKRI